MAGLITASPALGEWILAEAFKVAEIEALYQEAWRG
jgi:hypothetical protein